jgi:hypothetical protein
MPASAMQELGVPNPCDVDLSFRTLADRAR